MVFLLIGKERIIYYTVVTKGMYLEKLPREDKEFKKITHLDENPEHTFIDVTLTHDLLNDVDTYTDWLMAFQEHYNLSTGENAHYEPYDNIQIQGMVIPKEAPRIDFRVDYSHMALKFRIRNKDEAARDIVYTFLERILE